MDRVGKSHFVVSLPLRCAASEPFFLPSSLFSCFVFVGVGYI